MTNAEFNKAALIVQDDEDNSSLYKIIDLLENDLFKSETKNKKLESQLKKCQDVISMNLRV